jgi:hypothetical protein
MAASVPLSAALEHPTKVANMSISRIRFRWFRSWFISFHFPAGHRGRQDRRPDWTRRFLPEVRPGSPAALLERF